MTDLDQLAAAATAAGWRQTMTGPLAHGWNRDGDCITVTHTAGVVRAASFDYRDQPAGPDLVARVLERLATLPRDPRYTDASTGATR